MIGKKFLIREGAKIIGIYAGQEDFFVRKNEGAKTFLEEKKDVANTFFYKKKMTGQRLFVTEITFTAFLLLMLSCLTLDAECVICLDIVQFTTTHHCA